MTMPAPAPKPLSKPVDWDELYPGRFIKAGELNNKKVKLTIREVSREHLEGNKGVEVKGILTFEETDKAIPLNKTNGLCLKEMFGRKLSDWVGRKIWIYPDLFGDQPCIRIWGSPELKAPTQVEIKMPRRLPMMRRLHNTLDGNAPAQHREVRGTEAYPTAAQPSGELPIPDPDSMDPEPGANDGPF